MDGKGKEGNGAEQKHEENDEGEKAGGGGSQVSRESVEGCIMAPSSGSGETVGACWQRGAML